MKFIFLILLSFIYIPLKSQIDSLLKLNIIGVNSNENSKYISKLNTLLNKQLIDINLDENYTRNIYLNTYSIKYTLTKTVCEDTTCESGKEYRYIYKAILLNDSVAYSFYIDPLKKRHLILVNKGMLTTLKENYHDLFSLELDTAKLLTDNSIYSTNIGIGGDNISNEMKNLISAIKTKKYKAITCFLKSSLPEQRLYGLLGLEILKQKNINISEDVLKYYELSKNTIGRAYNCEGDICSLDEVQELIKRIPDLAKQIIKIHNM